MSTIAVLAALAACAFGGAPAPGIEREFVFEAAPFPECHAATLVELKDGAILTAWFGGREEGAADVAIWSSRRDPPPGKGRWSEPRKIAEEPGQPCWNPVLFHDASGTLRLFYKVGPSPERWSGAHASSSDGGATFPRRELLPAGLLGPIKDKPLLVGGDVLCGSSVESWSAWTCWVERWSPSSGAWRKFGPIAVPGRPHGIIQPALFSGDRPGEVVLLARSRGIGRVCRATSADEGATWSAAEPIDLPNPNSGLDAVRLRDGRVLVACNPTASGRTPLSLAVSSDLGRTWKEAGAIEDGPGEFSYPAIIQLSGGDAAVAYTWKRRRIGFARIPLAALPSP